MMQKLRKSNQLTFNHSQQPIVKKQCDIKIIILAKKNPISLQVSFCLDSRIYPHKNKRLQIQLQLPFLIYIVRLSHHFHINLAATN